MSATFEQVLFPYYTGCTAVGEPPTEGTFSPDGKTFTTTDGTEWLADGVDTTEGTGVVYFRPLNKDKS